MCEYCHEEYCCVHGRHHRYYHPGYGYRPTEPVYYYERPAPVVRREYLEDEKKILEQRLREIEKALAEESKQ